MDILIVAAIIAIAAVYTFKRLRKPSCGCDDCHCASKSEPSAMKKNESCCSPDTKPNGKD